VDGVADVWIEDGRVIAPPGDTDVRPERTIDARGLRRDARGVDMHCHIAGTKVNRRPGAAARGGAGRRLRASAGGRGGRGRGAACRAPFATGYAVRGLGYTTAVDAAIAPLAARHAHHELRDTPVLDKAFLVLMGNNHYVLDQIRAASAIGCGPTSPGCCTRPKGLGVKVVNPGGVESWKQGRGDVSSLDDEVPHFGVTPRQILLELARAVDELHLPHPVHVHGLNLGRPGNAATTRETMAALDGHRAHLAHIQFHSYGGHPDDPGRIDSQVPLLAEYLNAHPGLTVDVGQVLFGETTSMTADGPVGQFLHNVTGRKWISHDVEMETGCGVVPITYDDRNAVHALQWAIGLEWYLRVDDPWRIAMSTDHPNGGSFLAYPRIIALLMDRGLRADMLGRLPARVRARSGLADLPREYTLAEIAIITRAAPARMLGLPARGTSAPAPTAT
jgi:formylmethanofuran dehydrogenase subunit A